MERLLQRQRLCSAAVGGSAGNTTNTRTELALSFFCEFGRSIYHGSDRLPICYEDRFRGMRTNGIAVDHLFDHLVASCVDRILNGDNATELPSQNPIKYALVINLKTAKALGITIPASLLLRADEVIE
jgi:hypothetical protein